MGVRHGRKLEQWNARLGHSHKAEFHVPVMSMHALTRISEDRLADALGEKAGEGRQAGNESAAGLRALPKADVHCHALLNCPLSTYEHVLGYKLPPPPPRFRDFGEFGGYLASNLFPAIRTLDGIRALLRSGLERMAEEGVVYAEASIDLLLPTHIGVATDAVIEVVADERDRIADRLRFVPEIGINRRVPHERLWPLFVAYLDSGVFGGVDLYDDERAGELRDFQRFFRLARERGLALKAHAGETCGPERVRDTLEILGVDAIQHGIAAVQDPSLMEELARQGTQLNLGLASNVALGVAGSYEDHPIHALLAAGVNVALGTDDFAIFGAGLGDEIVRLRRSGMRLRDLAKVRLGPPA
jgi:adenosine deaminase